LRVSDAGRSQRCGLHRGRRPKAFNEDAMGRASTRILHPFEAFNRADPFAAAGIWDKVSITGFVRRQG